MTLRIHDGTFQAIAALSLAGIASGCLSPASMPPMDEAPDAAGPTPDAGPTGQDPTASCSADGECHPACPATLDPDCEAPEPPVGHVTPPDDTAECTNVQPLPADFESFLAYDTGPYTLSTGGAPCALYDEIDYIHIGSDQIVTIEAGVTLRFIENGRVWVQRSGQLRVEGTREAPVRFTGTEPVRGHWEGIYFENTVDFDTQESLTEPSRLSYAIVEHGGAGLPGSWDGNVAVRRARVCLEHVLLRESGTYGLQLEEHGYLSCFDGNTITSNTLAPVWSYPQGIDQLGSNSDFAGNDVEFVEIFGGDGDGQHEFDPVVWSRLNVPYRLWNEVVAHSDLTIEAGTTFVATEDARLSVRNPDAVLIAEGTPELPIVMKGELAVPGHWDGLWIENSDRDNVLRYVAIRDGGGAEVVGRANFSLRSDLSQVRSRATVVGCTFSGSAQYGVELWYADEPAQLRENNAFIDNAAGDVNASD